MPNIMHLLTIKAPPEDVYRALATAEGIRNWWTRDADFDAKVGGAGEFRFYGGRVVTQIRVDRLDAPNYVGWTTTASNASGGWNGTTIAFDLRAEGEGTTVRFAHRGFPVADDGYARVTTGWAYFLVSLRQYLETGAGAPAPDVDFARVIRA